MKFDSNNGNFNATFKVDTSITEPTVIYSSDYYYPQGYNLHLFDGSGNALALNTDYDLDMSNKNYVKVKITNASLNTQNISLQLKPKYI